MIVIKNISKSYGTKQVLHDINITFEKGKVYGVVGENGAGKTTLFKCIAGLENFEGEISSEIGSLKNNLGLLMTESYFFSKITGKEYIQLLANSRGIERVDFDIINIFDLPLNEYASNFSTGMKKKLAITGVLVQKNDVFILDEPFNGVDIQSNLLITEIIKKLKFLGKTIIISSHIFSTLSNSCDEILLLKRGKIHKKVIQKDFDELEEEMKDFIIGNKIDSLFL